MPFGLLHALLWGLSSAIALLWWGTPSPGLLAAVLLTPALPAGLSKRWTWWPASLVGPIAALLLFSATIATVPRVLSLPPVEDPLAAESSLALDMLAAAILVSGFVAPPLEALVQRATLRPQTPERLFSRLVQANYIAVGAAVGLLAILWQLPLDRLTEWSPTLTPPRVATVLVAALIGGVRGGSFHRVLRDLPKGG
ncbi:MAG: hypothetical protein VX899_14495 [Myxococcota bacterium]|nr:hypothetical protein [Myxococcota bacterium]